MVNGTRLPQIRSRKCRNRSRCRRCSCDRQRVPRRRARVSGLCGFRGTVERVPAKYQKTGRCAAVRERCGNGKRRRRPPAGGFRRRNEPQAARQEKAKGSCAPLGSHVCPQCGQFGAFGQGLLREQKQPCWGRKRKLSRRFKKNSGVAHKIGGKLAWQTTRSSFHSG